MFSTLGGYHWLHWGCSVHWGISWVHWVDVQYNERCHGYSGRIPWWVWGLSWVQRWYSVHWGIPWVHWGMFSTLGLPYKFSCFPDDLPQHLSWYPPGVLMISSPSVLLISPQCTEHPQCSHDIPHCTHDIPPVYWTSPIVLHILGVLHRHYAGWTSNRSKCPRPYYWSICYLFPFYQFWDLYHFWRCCIDRLHISAGLLHKGFLNFLAPSTTERELSQNFNLETLIQFKNVYSILQWYIPETELIAQHF